MDKIKPDYCIDKERKCEDCDFYFSKIDLCSLMPNEEVAKARLKERKRVK